MHKFRVLLEVQTGRMSHEDGCQALGIQQRTLKQLLTLWNLRLKHVVPLIDKLLEPVNTKNDQTKLKETLAGYMETTHRQVNRLLLDSGIQIPPPIKSVIRVKKHQEAVFRVDRRLKYALDVVAGLRTAEDAAEAAETTRRHIYRLAGDLLAVEGYRFIDLRRMNYDTRKQLADRLEESMKHV